MCGCPKATVTWKGPDQKTLTNNGHFSIAYRCGHTDKKNLGEEKMSFSFGDMHTVYNVIILLILLRAFLVYGQEGDNNWGLVHLLKLCEFEHLFYISLLRTPLSRYLMYR